MDSLNAALMDMMNPMRTKRISIIIRIILMSVKTGVIMMFSFILFRCASVARFEHIFCVNENM